MKRNKEFLVLYFLLGMFLFRLNAFSFIHEAGHLITCWMTGSWAVLKDWVTVEAEFLTPFSLYGGFGFQWIALFGLSVLFIWKEISNKMAFFFWGALHSLIIFAVFSSDFNYQAYNLMKDLILVQRAKIIWLCVTVPTTAGGWYLIIRLMIYNQNEGVVKLLEHVQKLLGKSMREKPKV